MTNEDLTSFSPSEPQLSAGSILSTPESDGVTTPKDTHDGDQQVTPQPKKTQAGLDGNHQGRTKMVPPPLPISITHPTPPKMSRLPSLQQITSRLNPSASSPSTSSAMDGSSSSGSGSTAPKLSLSTNVPGSASATSPFASSPSGRLKMPISAMKRTQSQQGTAGQTTPLAESSTASSFFATGAPLESPAPVTAASAAMPMTAGQSIPAPPPLNRGVSTDGYIKGYKDVPSLAQISKRVQDKEKGAQGELEKGASSKTQEPKTDEDGTSHKPDSEKHAKVDEVKKVVEASKPASEQAEHPLEHTWVLFYDSKTLKPDKSLTAAAQDNRAMLNEYENTLVKLGTINTVESFAQYFNNVKQPGAMPRGANYHLFKKGIVPMWEDPANSNGGKWVLLFRGGATNGLLDLAWSHLTMALVGGLLDPDDEVTGIVASNRPKIDRLQIWTRSRGDTDAASINALGKRITDCLSLSDRDLGQFSMEFQHNSGPSRTAEGVFTRIPFASERQAFPNAPLTPSKLGTSHLPSRPDVSPSMRGDASLPPLASPTPSHGRLAPPGAGETMRRIGSGQGMGAFSGPMGTLSGRQTPQGRVGVAGAR